MKLPSRLSSLCSRVFAFVGFVSFRCFGCERDLSKPAGTDSRTALWPALTSQGGFEDAILLGLLRNGKLVGIAAKVEIGDHNHLSAGSGQQLAHEG